MDNKKVLCIYNQGHSDDEDMQKVTDKVQDWIREKAEELCWDEIKCAGGQ